jgi:hypothetical protein
MAGLVAFSPVAMAAGKDALWEITTQMQIEGMPEMPKGFSMPGMPGGLQKQTVCLAEGKQYEPEQQKECKVLEQKQVGKKMTMKVKCKEGTMTVENEQVSKDHWRSKVTMSGEHAGTINSEGKRIGTCDAASEGGMSRETQKMMGEVEAQSAANVAELGKMCQKAVTDWPAPHPFDQYDAMAKQRKDQIAATKGKNMKMVDSMFPEVPLCAKAKADYCAKSKAAGREIATRKGYSAFFAKHDKAGSATALSYCGVESASLLPGHCKSAVAESDYAFVASFCPAERKTLAEKHCAGRAYTAVEAVYQPLCSRGSGGGRSYTSAAGAAVDATGQAVEQGVKQLKKLFGF